MNATLGWATILRKKQCTQAEVREGIEVIERNCRAQAQLMDDAVEVSRIISGKLRSEIKPCDLASVIYAAIDEVDLRRKCLTPHGTVFLAVGH